MNENTEALQGSDDRPMTFEQELAALINRYSLEQESDTPDFLLAEYLKLSLSTFKLIVKARDKFYHLDASK